MWALIVGLGVALHLVVVYACIMFLLMPVRARATWTWKSQSEGIRRAEVADLEACVHRIDLSSRQRRPPTVCGAPLLRCGWRHPSGSGRCGRRRGGRLCRNIWQLPALQSVICHVQCHPQLALR